MVSKASDFLINSIFNHYTFLCFTHRCLFHTVTGFRHLCGVYITQGYHHYTVLCFRHLYRFRTSFCVLDTFLGLKSTHHFLNNTPFSVLHTVSGFRHLSQFLGFRHLCELYTPFYVLDTFLGFNTVLGFRHLSQFYTPCWVLDTFVSFTHHFVF